MPVHNLNELSLSVKNLAETKHFDEAETMAIEAMAEYPDSPIPHNLYGIILDELGQHLQALRHYRAASALDPTYQPALFNLSIKPITFCEPHYVFTEDECKELKAFHYELYFNEKGIGQLRKVAKHNA